MDATPAPSPCVDWQCGDDMPAPSVKEKVMMWLTVLLFIVGIYAMCYVGQRMSQRCTAAPLPHRSSGSTESSLADDLDATSLARLSTLRSIAAVVESMTAEQRRKHVTQLLITKKYHAASRDHDDAELGEACETDSTSTDNSIELCAICLEPFREDDDICISQNDQCDHCFHVACALEWLQKSQLCPCCRRDFLYTPNMKYANQVAASTGIDPALGDDVERSIIADNTLSRRDSDHNGFVETSMSTIAAADSQC